MGSVTTLVSLSTKLLKYGVYNLLQAEPSPLITLAQVTPNSF